MNIKKATIGTTESDLESRLHHAIAAAFPWLPGPVEHQLTFSVPIGHKKIPIDAKKAEAVKARLDVLVSWRDQPLAVFELKRDGEVITKEDEEQGLSYARLHQPSPPLVVITNGKETRLLETYSCRAWTPGTPSEEALAQLVKNATSVAQDELKKAVDTLMGASPSIWVEAVRQTTDDSIRSLMGDWSDPLAPFVPDFLIPRMATKDILKELKAGARVVVVEGPPLIGKSSVLRELVEGTRDDENFAVLFLDVSTGVCIFQRIAYMLSDHLGWPVTAAETRSWLQKLSRRGDPALVLAIDAMDLSRNDVRNDIEELISGVFGNGLRIVMSVDESVIDNLTLTGTGRQRSSIGRVATRISVGLLNDEEFHSAIHLLHDRMIGMIHGAQLAIEYRLPWVLRTLIASIMCIPGFGKDNVGASLPPLLSLGLIDETRKRFKTLPFRARYQSIAKAILDDVFDPDLPIPVRMHIATAPIVRKQQLLKYLPNDEIKELISNGYLRTLEPISAEEVLTVRIPELLASEMALVHSERLKAQIKDEPDLAAHQLSKLASSVPFGDVIAAYALANALRTMVDFNTAIVSSLVDDTPTKTKMEPGTSVSGVLGALGYVEMTVLEGNKAKVIGGDGKRGVIELGESNSSYSNSSWLILSHFASFPMEVASQDGKDAFRLDGALLLDLGSSPLILVRPNAYFDRFLIHEDPETGESIMCHRAGIVEPITASIYFFLLREMSGLAESWIQTAVESGSEPLLSRIHIALREIARRSNDETSTRAKKFDEEIVSPAQSIALRHEDQEQKT